MSSKHIEINIGKACNNKCRFCMSSRVGFDEKQLTNIDIVKAEIEKYSEKGYKSIGFLGGDISIHPKIFDIIKHSNLFGFEEISVITNGMLFDDYDKALKLIESGVTRVNISIHSHIDSVEDYLTQIKGGLSRKLKAIDNFNLLISKGLLKSGLSINIVLSGLNYKNIVETCLYFYKFKGIADIRINFLWNRFFFEKQDKLDLSIKYSDILIELKKLIYISLTYKIRITFDSIPPCIFYKVDKINYKTIIKRFLGEEYDKITEISNLNNSVVFDWKSQKKDKLKTKFYNCNKCRYIYNCQGVRKEYVKEYGENEFTFIRN